MGEWGAPKPFNRADGSQAQPGAAAAGGPGGVVVGYVEGAAGAGRLVVARSTDGGGTFGRASAVTGTVDPIRHDLHMASNGLVTAIWRESGGRLRFRQSPDGTTWSAPAHTLPTGGGDVYDPHVVAAADGSGWAVWQTGPSGGGAARAVPLSDGVADAPATEPPSGGGPGAGGPPVQADPPRTSGTGRRRTGFVTIGDDRVGLDLPRACVRPGGSFRVRVIVRSRKPKGKVVVKVRRVQYFVNQRLRKTTKRRPFSATITVKGLRPGSTQRLRAKVQLKVRTGPRRSRSIRATFRVCPR